MLEGHSGPLKDMALAANGSVVVTASEDGTARAWDLVSPKFVCSKPLSSSSAFK